MRVIDPEEFRRQKPHDLPAIHWRRVLTILVTAGVVILALLIVSTGFYTVQSNERGVVLRFGKIRSVTQPGLHFKLPWPVETVYRPRVEEVKRIEIGFVTVDPGPPARYQPVGEESLMLTGDTNIVDLDLIVQYQISDPVGYLFNVRDVNGTVKDAAQAAIRQVVGDSAIDDIMTTGKTEAALQVQEILQSLVDRYECGVRIVTVQLQDVYPPESVRAAFAAVNSAREEKNQMMNEAEAYKERVVPEAKGRAEKMLREAEGYREERIARAQGDTSRFLALLEEYQKAPEVTRRRLYIETLEKVLPGMKKYLVDAEDSSLLKLLPLQEGGQSK